MVPRKLYRVFDSSTKATLALKLVESYGFEAACIWAERHLAVPSMVVRYVLHDATDAISVHIYFDSLYIFWLLFDEFMLTSIMTVCIKAQKTHSAFADAFQGVFGWCPCHGCLRTRAGKS